MPEKILDCFLSVEDTSKADIDRWNRTTKMNRTRAHLSISKWLSDSTTDEVEFDVALMELYYESLGADAPSTLTDFFHMFKGVKRVKNKRGREEVSE